MCTIWSLIIIATPVSKQDAKKIERGIQFPDKGVMKKKGPILRVVTDDLRPYNILEQVKSPL